jgi:hypothetical protein
MTTKLGKTIALVFITCAFQVHVIAGPRLMGKLRTRNNKPVLVNSNKAGSGTTIMSGAQIQCPDKIGATVDLGQLGRLDIAPNTDLTLRFVAGEVSVQLRSGYVVLTTKKGVTGVVTTSEGAVYTTDPSKPSSVIAMTKGAQGPDAAFPVGVGAAMLSPGAVAGAAGAGTAVIGNASSGRGKNLSTDNPRVP